MRNDKISDKILTAHAILVSSASAWPGFPRRSGVARLECSAIIVYYYLPTQSPVVRSPESPVRRSAKLGANFHILYLGRRETFVRGLFNGSTTFLMVPGPRGYRRRGRLAAADVCDDITFFETKPGDDDHPRSPARLSFSISPDTVLPVDERPTANFSMQLDEAEAVDHRLSCPFLILI